MTSESRIDVRYPDTDAMGVVHHAVYPVWYEVARMDFFAAIGFPYSAMHAEGIDPPLVDLHVTYRAPAVYPGAVRIRTSIRSFAPKKLELYYETFRDGEDLPISTATTFHIWTGPDGKSLDMEKNHPDIYRKIVSAAQK